MIFPTPFVATAERGFGSPSFFLSRLLREGSSGGGGVDSREESDESSLSDDGDPGADIVNDGVSRSKSGFSREEPDGDLVLFNRLGSDCELSEDAEDSSNVRLGDR
jgi:hypothetical protein